MIDDLKSHHDKDNNDDFDEEDSTIMISPIMLKIVTSLMMMRSSQHQRLAKKVGNDQFWITFDIRKVAKNVKAGIRKEK